LKAVNKTEVGFLGVKYDLLNKLSQEVYNLPDGKAEKILSEVRALVSQWP
jgi:hypothetical protein